MSEKQSKDQWQGSELVFEDWVEKKEAKRRGRNRKRKRKRKREEGRGKRKGTGYERDEQALIIHDH